MNKNKYLVVFFIFSFSLFLYSFKENRNIDARLINAIKNDKFISGFNLCKKKDDTIYVYNNTNKLITPISFKINCNKIICVSNDRREYDVNQSSPINQEHLILLSNYKSTKKVFELSFIETISNIKITMVFNSKNKLITFKTGVF